MRGVSLHWFAELLASQSVGDLGAALQRTAALAAMVAVVTVTISLADPSPLLLGPRRPWYLRLLAWLRIIEFVEPPPSPSPAERYEKARREIDALKEEMSRLSGVNIDWQDVGECVYGQQFHGAGFLQAFAAWYDHRAAMPEFLDPPEGSRRFPVWEQPKPTQRRFPTLTGHNLDTGYFLPVAFEGVYQVEPFKAFNHWELFHYVASTQTVLRELNDLLSFVEALPVREIQPGKVRTQEDAARMVAGWLREICELSVEHGLPVIFYG